MNRKLVALFLSLVMSMSTATVYAEPTNEETLQKKTLRMYKKIKIYKMDWYLNKIILI